MDCCCKHLWPVSFDTWQILCDTCSVNLDYHGWEHDMSCALKKKNNSRSKRPYPVTDTWGLRYRLLYHTNAGSLTCANVTIFTGMFMFFGMSKLVLACRDSYFLNKCSKTVSDEKELCRTLSTYFANIVFAITSLCKYTFQLV